VPYDSRSRRAGVSLYWKSSGNRRREKKLSASAHDDGTGQEPGQEVELEEIEFFIFRALMGPAAGGMELEGILIKSYYKGRRIGEEGPQGGIRGKQREPWLESRANATGGRGSKTSNDL